MTSESEKVSIEDAPATFKSFVWQHFGYPVEIINGNRVTDKTRTICKQCKKIMPYTAANTSTMLRHIQNHHSSIKSTAPVLKTAIGQTTLTDAYNYLLECTALDPRFRTLPQLDHDQCEAVFLRVQNKAKQLQQNQTTAEEMGEEAAGGAYCPTHGREEAVRAEPEVTEPAPKKTALEDLLGNSFSTEPGQSNRSEQAEREIEDYRKEASIPLSSCPLKWWQENCSQYPLLSQLAKAYLSVPATSVPSERVFSTAGDIVSAQRSQLLPENVDMLIFLKKNMTI